MSVVLGQSPTKQGPPYDPWPKPVILAIEAALREGMQRIKTNQTATDLHKADEHDITVWLYQVLIEIAEDGSVPGYTHDVFQYPQLDSPTINASRSSNRIRPDLRFHRQRSFTTAVTEPWQDAWFCECKIIEEKHTSRTYKEYCGEDGVQRFLHGKYAWAMPHAQMIAYVKWPGDPTGCGPAHQQLIQASKADLASPTIRVTTHARLHPLPNGSSAGTIELRHLWFKFL